MLYVRDDAKYLKNLHEDQNIRSKRVLEFKNESTISSRTPSVHNFQVSIFST